MNFKRQVNVTFTTDVLVFRYDWRALIIAYSAAIIVAIVLVIIGSIALISNGIFSDFKFSTIVRTTRNWTTEFDELFGGIHLGAGPLRGSVQGTKLKFGLLYSMTAEIIPQSRIAFGLNTQIEPLDKKTGLAEKS